VKRSDLLAKIAAAAKASDVTWEFVRQGGSHEVWRCGTRSVTVPRHREINEHTARGIMKSLDTELGVDWWR
jgi:predicted RNA binding protein YcfA (HicA-like mRNA interferase family)